MIDRHVKKTLDLISVQIHRDNAVNTGGLQQIGDEPAGDRLARRGFFVLTAVGKMRKDDVDRAGGSAFAGVDGDEQLHDVVIHIGGGSLHQINLVSADVFQNAGVQLTAAKFRTFDLPARDAEQVGYFIGHFRM